jgi:hypothetical protein
MSKHGSSSLWSHNPLSLTLYLGLSSDIGMESTRQSPSSSSLIIIRITRLGLHIIA